MPNLTLMKFDIIYPVLAFIPAMVFFYLLVKRLFNYKVALLSTAFLVVLPDFLYRTMAGFSEKEPLGLLLMFAVFYFFILAWQTKKLKTRLFFAAFSGLLMLFLKLVWGGADFLYMIIPLFMLISFLINKFSKTDFYVYLTWSLIVIISFLIKGYSLIGLLSSFTTGIPLLVLAIVSVDYLLIKRNAFNIREKIHGKIPLRLVSVGITLFAGLIFMSIISGPSFIIERLKDIAEQFIHPMGTSRFVLTVAEAKQPYFVNWLGSFRKFFYVFFIGSIYLFYQMIKNLGKMKWSLTAIYTLFISGFIFSRYSPSAKTFTGENFISNFVYLGSLIAFILILISAYILASIEILMKVTSFWDGVFLGFLIWFGFVLPVSYFSFLNTKKLNHFFINNSFYLLALMVLAGLLAG